MFQLKPNVLLIGQTGRLPDLNQSGIELSTKGVHNMVPQTPGLASLFILKAELTFQLKSNIIGMPKWFD